MQTFNDAVKRFKFQCRYMAFIDGDEFLYPKMSHGRGVVEVVDSILRGNPNAAGLAVNWQIFGSNNLEAADYSRGVLERFTRRAPIDWAPDGMGNAHVKTVANPRRINYMSIPHFAFYFEGTYALNERGGVVPSAFNNPVTADKLVVNHYCTKSREEYGRKVARGAADHAHYDTSGFSAADRNDEFDDGILKYRAERGRTFKLPDRSGGDARLFNALAENLSPTLMSNTPTEFYTGKLETFLTCRAVAAYLKGKLTDVTPAEFFEEASLKAILRSLTSGGVTFADLRLLLREFPTLLRLPYPAVKELRGAALQILPQMKDIMRINSAWREFVELDYLRDLLEE